MINRKEKSTFVIDYASYTLRHQKVGSVAPTQVITSPMRVIVAE